MTKTLEKREENTLLESSHNQYSPKANTTEMQISRNGHTLQNISDAFDFVKY